MSEQPLATRDDRIIARIDKEIMGAIQVGTRSAGVALTTISSIQEFAKGMALSDIGIRKHLRGNVGACFAVCVQAVSWGLDPFPVANKSYAVSDQIAYEASLIHAVILRRAPIVGRPKGTYEGDGPTRVLTIKAELKDEPGEWVEYTSPLFRDIKPKNSPLWVNDPDQQLWYFSVRAWCRRHFPDVVMGVYAPDEFDPQTHQGPESAKDITQASTDIGDRLERLTAGRQDSERHDAKTGEIIDPPKQEAKAEAAKPEPARRQRKAKETPREEAATEAQDGPDRSEATTEPERDASPATQREDAGAAAINDDVPFDPDEREADRMDSDARADMAATEPEPEPDREDFSLPGARAMTREGFATFKYWWNRLPDDAYQSLKGKKEELFRMSHDADEKRQRS